MSILEILLNHGFLGVSILKYKWFQTLITALAAAAFTQWLNNTLTKERDRENKLKESFKLFYNKVIPEIMDLFNIETDLRRGITLEALSTDEIRESILETVSNNISHINSEIYDAYRSVMTEIYKEKTTGFEQDVADITLYHTIVEEYIKLAEQYDNKDTKKEYRYACFLIIWKNVVINCDGIENSYAALSGAGLSGTSPFDFEKLNKETLQKLKSMDKEKDGLERDRLFKEILSDIIIKKDGMDNDSFEGFIEPFFSHDIEINNSQVITLLTNDDLFSDEESLDNRAIYRNRILSALYKTKYNMGNVDPFYKDFNFTKQEFEEFMRFHNELKNAIRYWEEKKILKIECKENGVNIVMTAAGDDYYEENLYQPKKRY
ncbi:hypothetical protein CN395_27180 [Priestia megaterium]|uniref:hypothetical protein n=1 Tax=Priestia megaterium TaxID=1404 RepID=UPI000BF8985E|nr:hypothetical protein [Priestia megaterium]PEU52772.1 hypothetical protein CN395_27180 [Priestia megaterium]